MIERLARQPLIPHQKCYVEIQTDVILPLGIEIELQNVNRVLPHSCFRIPNILLLRITLLSDN